MRGLLLAFLALTSSGSTSSGPAGGVRARLTRKTSAKTTVTTV